MSAVVEKICCDCGQDVSALKRIKDAQGHYYCQSCWDQIAKSYASKKQFLASVPGKSSVGQARPKPPATIAPASRAEPSEQPTELELVAMQRSAPPVRRQTNPVAGSGAGESADKTTPCPFCAEPIKIKALKCRFCGATLDGNGNPARVVTLTPTSITKAGTQSLRNGLWAIAIGMATILFVTVIIVVVMLRNRHIDAPTAQQNVSDGTNQPFGDTRIEQASSLLKDGWAIVGENPTAALD